MTVRGSQRMKSEKPMDNRTVEKMENEIEDAIADVKHPMK